MPRSAAPRPCSTTSCRRRSIARLGRGERTIADRIEPVTVLFADIVGFTKIAARLPPARLVADLDRLVSAFDELATTLGVEKIKTVGDAYLAVAGVPETRADHADAAAELALRMTETTTALAPELGADYRLRVGLHSGPVLAGVIGRRKFSYDVWGDTVNVASRLQQLSAPGEITISAATAAALERSMAHPAAGRGRAARPRAGSKPIGCCVPTDQQALYAHLVGKPDLAEVGPGKFG